MSKNTSSLVFVAMCTSEQSTPKQQQHQNDPAHLSRALATEEHAAGCNPRLKARHWPCSGKDTGLKTRNELDQRAFVLLRACLASNLYQAWHFETNYDCMA